MNTTIDTRDGSASAPVYLGYTQSELDRAFDQTQWASNLRELVGRWAETSRQVRETSPRMETRRYGSADMEPVLLSMRRAWVKLTPDEARQVSPILHTDRIGMPVTIIHGEKESPEFQRQAKAFHRAMQARNKPCDLIEMPGQNHFEVLDALHDPRSRLSEILVTQTKAI